MFRLGVLTVQRVDAQRAYERRALSRARSLVRTYVPRGLTRRVGSASSGFSGQ